MHTVDKFPGIGFAWLGPDVDDTTAELRAGQLSHFMRHEVHGPVYEEEFGLPFIGKGAPSGTPGDIPWRIEAMRQNHIVQPDGSYQEYIIAAKITENREISPDKAAILGLLVVTKPEGLCTPDTHRPSRITEIDVARSVRGTGLALHLLEMLRETHSADPCIDMETYQGNTRSQKFHAKLGFLMDIDTPLRPGKVYDGDWMRMYTTGETFWDRLCTLLQH